MTTLAIIVAMSQNRTIGINNTLPWRIPADLQRFKQLTMGHHIIMGRKTFDSIGKPLPGRTSVIVSRDRRLSLPGCTVMHSLPEAIAACAQDSKIFIIGGADIYAQTLDIVDTLHITEIQKEVAGDATFPVFDKSLWRETARETHTQKIPEPLAYHYVTYQRR